MDSPPDLLPEPSAGEPSARKQKTRQRILHGASEVVTERGIGAATVGDILEAAGVSRRTFYQHFRSKDDVLLALYVEVADNLVSVVEGGAAAAHLGDLGARGRRPAKARAGAKGGEEHRLAARTGE